MEARAMQVDGEKAEKELLLKAVSLCKSLQDEVTVLMKDVKEFINEEHSQDPSPTLFIEPDKSKQYTMVRHCDLECIKSEVMKMKESLPAVLASSLSVLPQLTQTEKELMSLKQQTEKLVSEKNSLKQKAEGYLVDYEQEKQEKFELKCCLNEVKHQLQQQVNYCSSLGCVCGTMLWRSSHNEDCIQNLLSGSRVNDFLQLVSATLHSYLSTYDNELPNESTQESQFVLSICGTVTNIAASAYGREYLSSRAEGKEFIKNMYSVLATAPLSEECAKIKSLILMLLYNISINQKGLTLLRSEPDLLRILMWLAKEESCSTVSVQCLQVVQSLILEPLTPSFIQQVMESVTPEILREFASSKTEEFKQVACEILVDIQRFWQQL